MYGDDDEVFCIMFDNFKSRYVGSLWKYIVS